MKVVIMGAGSCATLVASIMLQDRNFKLCGFIGTSEEEKRFSEKNIYKNIPFIGSYSVLKQLKNDNIFGFVVAVKNNALREKAFYMATQAGLIPVNVISPHAVIESSVSLGKGIVLSAGCILSNGVTIGDNTIVNPGTMIGIHTRVDDHCFLSTACVVEGGCHIKKNVSLGVRSTVVAGTIIGKNQTIEAGMMISQSLQNVPRNQFEL